MMTQVCRSTLFVFLTACSCNSIADECAILATGAASDLAIDDPDRFEYLTRICRGDLPAGKNPGVRNRAAPATVPRPAGSLAGQAPRDADKPKKLMVDDRSDPQGIGCEFLFYPVAGSKHPTGTEACKDGNSLICEKVTPNGARWAKGGSACLNAPDSARIYELNLKNAKETLKQMDGLYE